MNRLKGKIKGLVGKALMQTGVWDRLLQTWARRHETIILTYHRVIEKWDRTLDYSQPGMVVTAETFDRQLAFLKKHFHIVPLSSFVNLASNTQHQTPDRPLCAITFDDGWRDNYEIAFPILTKHGVPATIFLTTDFIGTNRAFWHTDLMYLLLHAEFSQFQQDWSFFLQYPSGVRDWLRRMRRMTHEPDAAIADSFLRMVKETCDQETIDRLVEDLAELLGVRRPLCGGLKFFLDWEQVRELAGAGIEIGSHGCSHRILTGLNREDAAEEMHRSKAEIEGQIGKAVHHFAFPDGGGNADLMTLAWKAGYRSVSLCGNARVDGQSRILALPRVGMSEAVSADPRGSFSDFQLLVWLIRGPKTPS